MKWFVQATPGGFASTPSAMTYCRASKIRRERQREVYGVDRRLPFHLGTVLLKQKCTFNKLIQMSSYTQRLLTVDTCWRACNRGTDGKPSRLPNLKYLQRLHARNEFLIAS